MDSPSARSSVFANPGFRRYWIGRVLATLAIQMQAVAVGWQVYDLTRDPLDLGLVGLAQFLPALGLALVTGHVTDRYQRRRVLSACILVEMLCALGFLTLTLTGAVHRAAIFGILVVFGSARAFWFPASISFLSNLVPPAQFARAAATNSAGYQSATIVGPALGGLLYVLGPEVVYAGVAALFAVAGILLARIPRVEAPREPTPLDWTSILAGVHFIRQNRLVLGAISLDLFAVLLGGATALLPVYARDILLVGPTGLGLLRSGPSIGALITGLVLARNPVTRHAGPKLLWTVAVFGLATIGFGLSRSVVLSMFCLIILGAADMVSVVIRRVLVLVATPDAMRGRVTAVESVFIGASNELGEFESGVTAAWFGVVPSVVIGGLGTLAIVAVWAKRFPRLRGVDRLEDLGERS